MWPLGWELGLALWAPPCQPLEPTRGPKLILHDRMPSRALLLLVDLGVLLLALQFVLKPVCAELHHVVHKGF